MSKQKKKIIVLVGIGILLVLAVAVALIFANFDNQANGGYKPELSGEQQMEGQEDTQVTKPAGTNPTGAKETDPTKPGETESTKPKTTEPTKSGETDPTKSNEKDPTEPKNTDPTKPGETQPTEPEGKDPTDPGTTPTEPEKETEPDEPEPTEPPPSVEIPDDDDEKGIEFPCDIPGYDVRLEKLAPYTGIFVEDGSNNQVTDVAMLQMYNKGTSAIERMEITVKYENETLEFLVSALPASSRMVVQEKSGKTLPSGVALEASALVVQRTDMQIVPEISVTDNGNNTLTVKNLTKKTIPVVRVFYKYYMEEEDMYVGGIAFTVRIANLAADSSISVQPSHYISKNSRVVMAQIYDS